MPKPQAGNEFRASSAIIVDSNIGQEVIGAMFNLPSKPFYKTWLGGLSILVAGICILGAILAAAGILMLPPLFLPLQVTETTTDTPIHAQAYGLLSTPTLIAMPTITPLSFTSSTAFPEATSTPSCDSWDQITASMLGDDVCVFGNVYSQALEPYGGSRVYFDASRSFFLVSSDHWFPALAKGDCVRGNGKVEQSTDGILYVNIYTTLFYCK